MIFLPFDTFVMNKLFAIDSESDQKVVFLKLLFEKIDFEIVAKLF